MNITTENKEIRILLEKPYNQLPVKIRRKYQRKIIHNFFKFCKFAEIEDFSNIKQINSFNLEKLQGKKNLYSVRLNKQYRVEFLYNRKDNEINILRISKHYEK